MGIILIILQILAAIPTLVKVVKEIIALIRGLPKHEQDAAKQDLYGIMMAIKNDPKKTEHFAHLNALLERLRRASKAS